MINLKHSTFLERTEDGIGAYGMGIEYLVIDRAGKMVQHVRMFIAGNTVSKTERAPGVRRAPWVVHTENTPKKASEWALSQLTLPGGLTTLMFQLPVIVELTPVDVHQIASGSAPHSRFSAIIEMEKNHVIDDTAFYPPRGDEEDGEPF